MYASGQSASVSDLGFSGVEVLVVESTYPPVAGFYSFRPPKIKSRNCSFWPQSNSIAM